MSLRSPRARLLRAWLGACLLASLASPALAEGGLNVVVIDGSINPASADYLIEAIERSEEEKAAGLLIELDTPGGLVSATKDILQAMLNAEVPVIVYVSPRGAWASSAGTFITVAGHVAAMAPGTSIGAAHPVAAFGGGPSPAGEEDDEEGQGGARDFAAEKAENFLAAYVETIAKERGRNVEWVVQAVRESVAVGEDEALELGVIDLVAGSRAELLEAIEGREVEVAGEKQTLALVGEPQTELAMTLLQAIFNVVADPNIAWLLMVGAALGLYTEFQSPGLILPGVAGAVCLVLFLISMQVLPFDWVALVLIAVGIGLLIAEIFVPSFGALFVGGVAFVLLGGTMLFDSPEIGDLQLSFWRVLVPSVVGLAFFGAVVVLAIGRSLWAPQTAGTDELVGLVGKVTSALGPEVAAGKVFVRGEYWNAQSDEAIEAGEPVEVVQVDGLRLNVRRASSGASPSSSAPTGGPV